MDGEYIHKEFNVNTFKSVLQKFGPRKEGVVYHDVVQLSLEVTTANDEITTTYANTSCFYATATVTNCTVDLPRGVYNITLTQTNTIGSSTADSGLFDCK